MSNTKRIMEQAQVFASAWSLVGGAFDGGDGMERAEEEKAELQRMVEGLETALNAIPSSDNTTDDLIQYVDQLEAQLAALAKQEPVAWMYDWQAPEGLILNWATSNQAEIPKHATNIRPLFARPAFAEPVNARLVEALRGMLSNTPVPSCICKERPAYESAQAALAAAEAQQAGPNTDPADMVNRAFQDGINSGYAQAMMDEMARHRQAEPEIVEGATCRNALRRDGKPFPKSSCQRCGTLLRPGWKCADGVEV